MTELLLYSSYIQTVFDGMCGKGMSQRMDSDVFVDTALTADPGKGSLRGASIQRLGSMNSIGTGFAWEQELGVTMAAPKALQDGQ